MNQNVQNEIIKDGADFVDRIDDQLKRMKKRRQDLCPYQHLNPALLRKHTGITMLLFTVNLSSNHFF